MPKRQISTEDALVIETVCQTLSRDFPSFPQVQSAVIEIRRILSRQVLIVDKNYNNGTLTSRQRVQSMQRDKLRKQSTRKRDFTNIRDVVCNVCSNAAHREVKHRAPECGAPTTEGNSNARNLS